VGATDEFSRASGIAVAPQPRAVELVAFEPTAGTPSTGLSEARVVVAGGRGLGSAEALDVLRRWAASVGAAFGTSRAPVEAGWAGFEELIGQTGTVVRPDLYLAFGVSGAPQHLAGIREARTVVSVNIDESAPLASEADVMITADVSEILEVLRAPG
jgi:electron transfer flavoprotein alpha subunit